MWWRLAQDGEQLVEQCGDLSEDDVEWESAVEQVGDGAEQIADEFTGPGLGGDVQVHGVQVHLQSEQVQVQRSEDEVQDLTGPGAGREVDREGQLLGALREAVAVPARPIVRSSAAARLTSTAAIFLSIVMMNPSRNG